MAPILANLKGFPPATIIAAELDPLQSDGQAYAANLQAAGVPVAYQLYKEVTHEFLGMGDPRYGQHGAFCGGSVGRIVQVERAGARMLLKFHHDGPTRR